MKRCRLIVNPAVREGRARNAVPAVQGMLAARDLSFDIQCTERPWHEVSPARQAVVEGCDVVVAVGGGFAMAPEAEIDDGLSDLSIAKEGSRARIFVLILRFMKGTQAGHPDIRTGRAQRITVTATDGVLLAHAGGETLCEDGNRLTMELLPRQIEVLSQRFAGER